MDIVDEIKALSARSIGDLDAIHDFVEHTTLVWRTFRVWVEQENSVEAKNLETGSQVNEQELLKLSDRYKTDYLLTFTFQHCVAILEAFIFDYLRLLLVDNPSRLHQEKQIAVRVLLSATDRQSLIHVIADHQLNELRYRKVGDWCDYINKLMHVGCPTPDEVLTFAEIKASRDILVHNSSIANQIYLDKACEKARCGLGEKIEIPHPYHQNSWRFMKKIVADISAGAVSRLTKS